MNEAWEKHIQPILDSWQWDHFSWVFEPFLKYYPTFGENQRVHIEDALALTAFDNSDEKLAIKALSIAEALHRAHIATPRLSELFRSELRKQFARLQVEHVIKVYKQSFNNYLDQAIKLKMNDRLYNDRIVFILTPPPKVPAVPPELEVCIRNCLEAHEKIKKLAQNNNA